MSEISNSQPDIRKFYIFGPITLLLIVFEAAFENTDLQIYNLQISRLLLLLEFLCFLVYFCVQKLKIKELLITFLYFATGTIMYVFLDSAIYIKFFLIAFIVSGIGYKSTFKLLFITRVSFTLITVLLALTGLIDKHFTMVHKSGAYIAGYGLGYTHPNRLASSITYILFCYLLFKKDSLKKHNLIYVYFIVITTYFITKSRTLISCFALFGIYLILSKIHYTTKFTQHGISFLGIVSVPLCATMSIVIPKLLLSSQGIERTVVYFINAAFSRRFTHVEHVLSAYPISLFGGTYSFDRLDYQFGFADIDNAYIRFLYSYGIVGLIIFCFLSVWSIKLLIKKKEYICVAICTISAVQGLLENIYIFVGLNIFILFWSELMLFNDSKKSISEGTDQFK